MHDAVITTTALTKFFRKKCVLDQLSFSIPRGSVTAILGRNGSGKTTTLRILLGLFEPTRGSSTILNHDSQHLPPQIRANIGYLAEGRGFTRGTETRGRGVETRIFARAFDDPSEQDLPGAIEVNDNARTLRGMAVVYNSLSEDLGGFREEILPGAFRQSLADSPDIRFTYNHGQLISRTANRTLRLTDSRQGLAYTASLPPTSAARDLATLVSLRTVTGSSFSFRVTDENGEIWSRMPDGTPLRQLRTLNLMEVSAVDCPAYPGTNGKLSLRRRGNWRTELARKRLELAEAEDHGIARDGVLRMHKRFGERQ